MTLFTAKYMVSCEEARMLNPTITEKDMIIDIDDAGPLEPFAVKCVFQRKCFVKSEILNGIICMYIKSSSCAVIIDVFNIWNIFTYH